MNRQILLSYPTELLDFLPDSALAILSYIDSPLAKLDQAIKLVERANNLSCVLVNQCAYSMILQTSEQMDREMAVTIPWMTGALKLFEAILPLYYVLNPLGGIAFTNRKHCYHANMDAYQTILDIWNDSWEWKTTTVTEVIDGDTIYVEAYDDPIRIMGIDCPETCHQEYDDCDPADAKWEAGYAAKAHAESLLRGQTVYMQVMKQRDYYDRLLAKVRIGAEDGTIFANEMVRHGHAKFFTWCFPTTLSH